MGGYFAVPPEVWPALRDRLPRPLSRDEAIVDLRYWQDRELAGIEEMPGYRLLGRSWGWGEESKKARNLLSNEVEWSDPWKLSDWRARKGRGEGADGAREGRGEGAPPKGRTPAIDEKGRGEGAEGAQEGRARGDTHEPPVPRPQVTVTERVRARATPSVPPDPQDPPDEQQRSTPRPPEPKGSGLSGGWVGTDGAVDEALSQVRDGGPEALASIARISATIRGRPVGKSEATRDAPSVAAALELGGATLPELEAQVELVAAWAQESPQGRDELGGIRLATGERWGIDRSRRPAVVLGPRWLEWLDAARAWDAGRVATATAPPSELYQSPLEAATAAYGDPEAEARLDERAIELVRRWKVSDGLAFEEAAK